MILNVLQILFLYHTDLFQTCLIQSHLYFKNLSAGSGGFDPKALGTPDFTVLQARCSAPGSSPSDMAAEVLKWQECVRAAQSKCRVSSNSIFSF
jgi:hypothetical protein